MARFPAALVPSVIGIAIMAALQFSMPQSLFAYLPLLIAPVAGIVAAILAVRNPKKAGKGGGEGALTGLIVGALVLVGGALVSLAYVQVEPFDTLVKTQGFTISQGQAQDTVRTILTVAAVGISIGTGLLGLGLAAGTGAIAGAVAKRRGVPVTAAVPS